MTTGYSIPSRSTAASTFAGVARGEEPAGVDADHAQPVVRVALVPRLQVRERAQRVDAAEVPELDEHGPAALLVHAQRRDVDPRQLARERRGGDGVLGRAHGAEASSGFADFRASRGATLAFCGVRIRQSREAAAVSAMFTPFPRRRVHLAQADHGRGRRDRLARPCRGAPIAQTERRPGDAEGAASPTKAGTKKKPKNVKLDVRHEGQPAGHHRRHDRDDCSRRASSSRARASRSATSTTSPPSGPTVCPAGSKAGSNGTANALVGPANAPLNFDVYAVRRRLDTLSSTSTRIRIGVQSVDPGQDHEQRPHDDDHDPAGAAAAGGLDATLTGISQTFSARQEELHRLQHEAARRAAEGRQQVRLRDARRRHPAAGPRVARGQGEVLEVARRSR